MPIIGLGVISVPTPGTLVPVMSPGQKVRSQSLLVQALANTTHTNTGNVYVYSANSGSATVRVATLAIPTANTVPSFSVTIPNAPGGLEISNFYLDADIAGDGADVSYVGP